MRNHPLPLLALPALLLSILPQASAALTPAGAPFAISDETRCTYDTSLDVIAMPKGAFEAVWIDDWDYAVQGRRFGRDLQPTGAEQSLMPLHGGLVINFLGASVAGRYELVLNVLDFDQDPADPAAAYRMELDLDGDPLTPPSRFETQRFLKIAPAAGGDSLRFRYEPPYFGPSTCRSRGLLASRIDRNGAPLSAESRVNRRASAWAGGYLVVNRLPDDTFLAVYTTCEKFRGLVARRLNAVGVPVGKPIDLPLPGQQVNFSGGNSLVVAARGAADFAVAAVIDDPVDRHTAGYTRAVSNGKVFGPTPLVLPAGFSYTGRVFDLAESPSGGYLLLFEGNDQEGATLFAQQLDARGVQQGNAVAIAQSPFGSISGAAASLPDGRWIVVAREQTGDGIYEPNCRESFFGTVLAGD